MKLWRIEPHCYGDVGTIVVAETKERAEELWREKTGLDYALSIEMETDDLEAEYVCRSFLE